jgi:small subunit ribosomal protein S16
MGRKKIPVFSIVATDSRNARDGRYIEDLGRYYPLKQPAEVKIDQERVIYWLNQGAQPSDTVRSILSKRGILLRRHLQQKGKSEDEIAEAVEAHLEQVAERGGEIKMTAEMRRQKALEEERARAKELEEEARKRAEEERKAKEEAEKKAAEEAKAKEEAAKEQAAKEEAAKEEAAEEEAGEAADEEAAAEAADEAAEDTADEADASEEGDSDDEE